MIPYLPIICILIIGISISHSSWDNWQTALYQHCNSINSACSGTSWKLKYDALFVYNHWHLYHIYCDIHDIWQTALHQHCNSISSGTSLKLEYDALFIYNMYINYLVSLSLIFVEIFDKQHCTSTATASAQAQVWSSNMMPYLSLIYIYQSLGSLSRIFVEIYDNQHCTSTAPALQQHQLRHKLEAQIWCPICL